MKAFYKVNPLLTIQVESEQVAELLEQLTDVNESIAPEPCGRCKSTNTFPQARRIEDNTFYEIKCKDCGAMLQLGKHKRTEKLYKKKMKTDDKGQTIKENGKGVYLDHNGWRKYNPKTKELE